ncbi:murein biosynthesis integral membrane protein MurJ [Candidatus Uhrbacteria bacterium RIFCSPHIGHO2_02_FULL_47_44]|uniref:Probable lipid II flippase MurJ n=1 Tax=Candidatus Uhrbacteria bacterium RIFCSPLOWO2_02_FULL_48_18 TaxID=1802408 RepID=A0A1F7VC16_9BACT|nr:MAG: murein biosynthesis integral membrane protein MurJ [Candidatus Uhrbacteria bacterium RIFCSPHIGHO2_02_FULL_47_44]OGL87973.1 MAG: murein biosynthesis integral membrane protein MurJ [Candidatus Uhrbacteria bacterium RIFCSPLOWO2_02_FULL_48_18]
MFKAESTTVIGAAVLVGLFSFLSRLVGLIRDRVLAGMFGAGNMLDIYYAAFKVPDFLFNLIVIGALSASFIPMFTRHYQQSAHHERAWKFTNNMLNLIGVGMVVLAVILFIFANHIAVFVAPGFDHLKQAQVASFTRVMLLSQIFLAISMVYGGVLQSMKRFFLYSLAPIFYNVGIIFGALFFVRWFGTIGLAYGVVFGAMLHMGIQCIGLRGTGYRYQPMFQVRDRDTQTVLRTMLPRMIGIGTNQILFLILTIIASTLAVGSVTVFQFAYNVEFFPIGIFGVSYAIAVFPTFAEHVAANKMEKFQTVFASSIRQLLFFMIPATIAFLLLRAQIVRLVVGAGAFDWNATILAADTLAFFALTFIPQSCVYILSRAFFALQDTVTPLTAAIVSAMLGITSAFLFTKTYGVIGLAMAFGVAETVNAGLLWILLRQKTGSLHEMNILEGLFKLIPAALLSGIAMYAVRAFVSSFIALDTFLNVLTQTLITGIAGAAVYLSILTLLRSEELHTLFASLTRRQLQQAAPIEVTNSTDGTA